MMLFCNYIWQPDHIPVQQFCSPPIQNPEGVTLLLIFDILFIQSNQTNIFHYIQFQIFLKNPDIPL